MEMRNGNGFDDGHLMMAMSMAMAFRYNEKADVWSFIIILW